MINTAARSVIYLFVDIQMQAVYENNFSMKIVAITNIKAYVNIHIYITMIRVLALNL